MLVRWISATVVNRAVGILAGILDDAVEHRAPRAAGNPGATWPLRAGAEKTRCRYNLSLHLRHFYV
jgi:hypothetical protein